MSSGAFEFAHEYCDYGAKPQLVFVRAERGVWRQLIVTYDCWEQEDTEHCAVFNDKRCEHVRKLFVNDMNVHIADALKGLPSLEELMVTTYSQYAPPPGVWPQLRRLTVDRLRHTIADRTVLSMVAAAPNVRWLRVFWTHGLHCLPAILAGLPKLEVLILYYAKDDTRALVDCKHLDKITPRALVSVRLLRADGDKDTDATVELAAALGRMRQRAANRFTFELGAANGSG